MTSLPLSVVKQTNSSITVSWTPPSNCEGFEFLRDSKRISNTWDPTESRITFSIPDSNPHTFEVRALNVLANGSITVNQPTPPPPPDPTPSSVWWVGPQPPSTAIPSIPSGTSQITSPSDLKAVCASGGRGGTYVVVGFTYTGNLDIGNRNGLTLFFDPSWKLVGPGGSSNPAVGVHGAGLKLYGGDISNPQGGSGTSGGDGVKAYVGSADSADVSFLWHGLKIHDVAAQGFSCQASNHSINVDVEVEVTRWGLNTSLDPHAIKGTGLHGAYIGGGTTPTTGSFIFFNHDGATGAAVQAGANLQNATVWISASNLSWTKDSLAGNGFQPWGSNNKNVVVKSLLVNGAQTALFTESLTGGSVKVEYSRYKNVRLNPAIQTNSHLTLGDVSPA